MVQKLCAIQGDFYGLGKAHVILHGFDSSVS